MLTFVGCKGGRTTQNTQQTPRFYLGIDRYNNRYYIFDMLMGQRVTYYIDSVDDAKKRLESKEYSKTMPWIGTDAGD